MTNVPTPLKAFLPLWVVGSVVGATQKVDMHHLRRTWEVRILVAVLDVKDIPKKADICVNRSIFRVYFKVDEVVLDDSFNPEDYDLLGDDAGNGINDDIHNDADGSGDHQMEDATDGSVPKAAGSQDQHSSKPAQDLNQQQQDALIDEVLDLACEQLINEISFKVMVETDGGDRPYSPPTAEDYATYSALVDSSKAGDSFASEMLAPVLGTSDSPDTVVGEASSTTSPGFAAQEVLPSLVQEGFQGQAGDYSASAGDTPRQVPVGPGPEQPPTVLVGGVGIAGSIPEMMPADGNAVTAALFLQEELTVLRPRRGFHWSFLGWRQLLKRFPGWA